MSVCYKKNISFTNKFFTFLTIIMIIFVTLHTYLYIIYSVMKRVLIVIMLAMTLAACHESIEDRAEREAREFTRRFCPTPTKDYIRTDSIVFRRATREYIYYCTITDEMDNVEVIDRNRQYIHNHLLEGLRQSTDIMAYKQAGFIFVYECKSDQNPDLTLYHDSFGPDDYREPKPEK